MAKALVTGGCGYVGTHVVRELLQAGWQVTVVDNDSDRVAALCKEAPFSSARFINRDICTLTEQDVTLGEGDAVFHFAGIVGARACAENRVEARASNVEGTQTLARAILAKGAPTFVFASTCSIYGDHGGKVLTEQSPVAPADYYSDTKVVGEAFLQSVWPQEQLRILRFGTLFGASHKMRDDLMVNAMCKSYVRDGIIRVMGGNRSRPLVHCQDAARYAVDSVNWAPGQQSDGQKQTIVNICPQAGSRTILEVARTIQALYPDARLLEEPDAGDKRDYRVDGHLLSAYATLKNQATLEFGIEEMVSLMRRQQAERLLKLGA